MNTAISTPGRMSAISLIGANLIAIALAILESWSLHQMMVIYWAQSVIIGYFSIRRILNLREFSTEGVSSNGGRMAATAETKRNMAGFFALHYGMFHLAYLLFLTIGKPFPFRGDMLFLLMCVAVFFLNHRYSYIEHSEQDAASKPNIGTIMFFPYMRTIPMHLTIIVAGAIDTASTGLMLMFLFLKTSVDVSMHNIEHSDWRMPVPE